MFNRKTNNEKLSVRFTLKEKEIRSQMTNFYISLATHANAEVFLKNNPALIDKKIARGNDFTKDKTVDFSYWLKILQELSVSDEKFEKQILGPVRDVANYVLNIKGRTTKIAGWVFAKSKPFEDTFSGGTRISVSLLVPELRTVMSLRCDAKTGAKIDYGFYDFEQVKPIPMTNRLHQFHPDIKKIEVGLNLAECNFLKTSMGDLKPFSCSLEMEHYCEVSSNQSKKRHLLGAVLVIGGKVVSVEWPYLRIASVVDPDQEYEFHMSEDLEKISHCKLEDFRDKLVRALCVCWYDSGLEKISHPKYPEIVFMDGTDDENELVQDDIIGFVRLRNKTTKKELETYYPGINFSQISQLVEEGGFIQLSKNQESSDPVIKEFLKATGHIRELRADSRNTLKELRDGTRNVLLTPEAVLDIKRVSVNALSRRSEDYEVLLRMLSKTDFEGMNEFDGLPIDDKKLHRKKLWWFNVTDLISKNDKKIVMTDKGFEVAYLSQKNRIAGIIKKYDTAGIIFLPEIEDRRQMMLPSLIVKYLEEESNFKKAIINNVQSNLWWTLSGDPKKFGQMIKEGTNKISEQLFEKMRKVRYPLKKDVAYDMLMQDSPHHKPLSYFSAKSLIALLAAQRKIKSDGDFLDYKLEYRIVDFFIENPLEAFSAKQIAEHIVFPIRKDGDLSGLTTEMREKIIEKTLSLLGERKFVVQKKPRLWIHCGNSENLEQRCKDIVKQKVRNIIIQTMKNKPTADETQLLGMLGFKARELCENSSAKLSWRDVRDDAIKDLVSKNEIVFDDGFCKRGSGWDKK